MSAAGPSPSESDTADVAKMGDIAAVASAQCRNWLAMIGFPTAVGIAYVIHYIVSDPAHIISDPELALETHHYSLFLAILAGAGVLLALLQIFVPSVRRYWQEKWPVFSVAIMLIGALQIITTGLHLLPLPYFPGPPKILQSAIHDRELIWTSTYHSLFLLAGGYLLGVFLGLVTGVSIGWFKAARYWGMPVMKVIGPIPATAWIPLALVIATAPVLKPLVDSLPMVVPICLIAIAVWFPVTMLTSSGISNTRASYLDVARTLGAKPSFLIFRVAIPAAMPNIFLGLFMGLGAAFLTLVVAESVGVKSGLGWYLSWAREWAEYGKVYAGLVIMSLFFSTIMTCLFAVRDKVLVWQKGTIKW